MILIIRKVSVTNFFTLVKFSEQIPSPLSHFLKDLLKIISHRYLLKIIIIIYKSGDRLLFDIVKKVR